MDKFTQAYIAAAFWTETSDGDDVPLDDSYGVEDLDPAALSGIVEDCNRFQTTHALLLKEAYESGRYYTEASAGHDFWLTRNRHGAGYWDRDLDDVGESLSEAARLEGGRCLYVGDDNKIYAADA